MKLIAHNRIKAEGVTDRFGQQPRWLRGVDLNHRPLGYEPNELPDCSTPRKHHSNLAPQRQTCPTATAARASSVLQLVALTRRHDLGWIDSLAVHLLFQDFPIFADQEIHPACGFV